MKLQRENCRLYLVTDRRFCKEPLEKKVMEAVSGGVTMVQLREKQADAREVFHLGCRLSELLKPLGVPLIVNDRVDLCMAIGADGVHLGQKDLPVSQVRSLLGPEKIIGATASSIEQAMKAEAQGADYLGVGAIFATKTKKDHSPVIGFEGLAEICKAVEIPVVAISGIDADNCAEAIMSGADGIAVVSAILDASDVRRRSEKMRSALDLAAKELGSTT